MLPLRENFRSFRGDSPGCRTLLGWRLDECLTLKASTQLFSELCARSVFDVPPAAGEVCCPCGQLSSLASARERAFHCRKRALAPDPSRPYRRFGSAHLSGKRCAAAASGADFSLPNRRIPVKKRPRSVGSDRGRLGFIAASDGKGAESAVDDAHQARRPFFCGEPPLGTEAAPCGRTLGPLEISQT